MTPVGDDFGHDADRSLAAEYVLGVLSAAERRMAEARLDADAGFAAEVAYWEHRLGPIADTVPAVPPPPDLFARIEAQLPRKQRAARPAPRPSLWQSLAFWRGIAFGSLGLAGAAIAALVALLVTPPTMPAPMVAQLGPPGGAPVFVATMDPMRHAVMVMPASLRSPDQRVPELWIVPSDGVPRSLGVFDPERPTAIEISPAMMPHFQRSAALAVSLEPPGGSPTGKPTGPVVAQGPLVTF